jgi:hypothetical protein
MGYIKHPRPERRLCRSNVANVLAGRGVSRNIIEAAQLLLRQHGQKQARENTG